MKSIKEYIESGGASVSEASETHVFLDDVKQELDRAAGKIYQDVLSSGLMTEKQFRFRLMDVMYKIFDKFPGKEELDKITAHVNDDGYIDKMYAEEYARKAIEITLMHIGLELMDKKPFDFGKPKKIAKAAAAKHCKLCK